MISSNNFTDITRLSNILGDMSTKIAPVATQQAINRTLSALRTEAKGLISKETGIKVSKVNKRLLINKANKNKLSGKLDASRGKATNLSDLMTPKQIQDASRLGRKKTQKGRYFRGGVRVKAWGKRKEYTGTFIGSAKSSGKQLVYKRETDGRGSKLKSIAGPSIRRTFSTKAVRVKLINKASATFDKEYMAAFKNQVARRLKRK